MIFTIIQRSKKIIRDTGYIKCELLLFGVLLIYISFNFSCFSNYLSCALKYLFKHCGILLLFEIIALYISSAYRLGITNEESGILNLEIFKDSKIISSNYLESESLDQNEMLNIEKKLNEIQEKNRISIISQNEKNSNISKITMNKSKTISESQYYTQLNKNILFLHTLYTELISIYIIFIIIFISLILFYSKKNNVDIQEKNGKWRYQCPLDKLDLALNIIEFILIIYITRISIITWNYIYVFKCTKNINYSIIIFITLGPLINVILIIN